MIEDSKEMIAKIREKAASIAEVALGRLKRSALSARTYVASVVGRMTVKERLLVLFAVGLVLGFGVKTAANGSVTIGYQDYTLKGKGATYDLNEVARRVAEKNAAIATGAEDPAATPSGGSCQ
ncbi:MAG: hypothetical protein WCJ25_00215 [Candidatus Moraniibacteriota bacterium]